MLEKEVTCCDVILSVFFSPIGLYCVKGKCNGEMCINILLFIFAFSFIGTIHAFCVYGLDCCTSTLCALLPPVGILVGTK